MKELDQLRCINEDVSKCDYCIDRNDCDREEKLREEQGASRHERRGENK